MELRVLTQEGTAHVENKVTDEKNICVASIDEIVNDVKVNVLQRAIEYIRVNTIHCICNSSSPIRITKETLSIQNEKLFKYIASSLCDIYKDSEVYKVTVDTESEESYIELTIDANKYI